jgi:hypothetical protein
VREGVCVCSGVKCGVSDKILDSESTDWFSILYFLYI